MRDMGYLPVVNKRSWQFQRLDQGKIINCTAASGAADDGGVVKVAIAPPDYIIDGDVGVSSTRTGWDRVDLKIQVIRELPTHCKAQILIEYKFKPNSYDGNGIYDLSVEFSEKILPPEYEQKWLASVGTCK